MKMKLTHLFLAGGLLTASSVFGAAICPTTSGQGGTDSSGTGCSLLVTFASGGTATVSTTGLGPYDNSEDVTVGVINNGSTPISSVTLSSSSGTDAFGFDGDGIQAFASTNGVTIGTGGATGYEGPNSVFDLTGVVGGDGTLVVNFSTAIGAGAGDYFSLEGTPAIGGGITVGGGGGGGNTPEPASLVMLGTGLGAVGLLIRRRRAKQ